MAATTATRAGRGPTGAGPEAATATGRLTRRPSYPGGSDFGRAQSPQKTVRPWTSSPVMVWSGGKSPTSFDSSNTSTCCVLGVPTNTTVWSVATLAGDTSSVCAPEKLPNGTVLPEPVGTNAWTWPAGSSAVTNSSESTPPTEMPTGLSSPVALPAMTRVGATLPSAAIEAGS